MVFFFFFSSRRRHTRWTGDWSSNVCSSDLYGVAGGTWSYKGDSYDAMVIAAAEGDLHLEVAGTIPLGVMSARCYGRTTLTEGQSAFVTLFWGGGQVPASLDEAFSTLTTTVG